MLVAILQNILEADGEILFIDLPGCRIDFQQTRTSGA